MDNDETLWKGLMRGDKEMFLALYKKYYHCLLFIGLKEMKDASLVKDSIQQLFLYLWEKRASIMEAKNVKSYLVTSFLRKLSSDWKTSGKYCNLQAVTDDYTTDPQPTPEEKLINKDEHIQVSNLLMTLINDLPNRQKELIVLKFYEGLSYDEIVEKTGLSHRTVYNKIHEALKKLKLDIVTGNHSRNVALLLLISLFTSSLAVVPHN